MSIKKPTRPVLVTLPVEWIEQLDTLARFYNKSRLAFIRDFIAGGLKALVEKYESSADELAAQSRIFREMEEKALKAEASRMAVKSRWEDSY